ncbi:MAG: hypothetical protein V4530_10065 [Pseudomonadota bacterium]
MSRVSAFFVYLTLVLSLGMGSVAHAAENAGCVEIAADSGSHTDGDADQKPDTEKGVPHHHGGCHGHHVGVPEKPRVIILAAIEPALPSPFDASRMTRAPADPALRPPIA